MTSCIKIVARKFEVATVGPRRHRSQEIVYVRCVLGRKKLFGTKFYVCSRYLHASIYIGPNTPNRSSIISDSFDWRTIFSPSRSLYILQTKFPRVVFPCSVLHEQRQSSYDSS